MSDQTVINPTSATAQQELSPLESFANETASTGAAPVAADSSVDSVAQPAAVAPTSAEQPFHADAPIDLDQQLATQDTLANGSASASTSSASTPGVRNEQAAAPVATPVAATAASDAVAQDVSARVKDFVQAFSFVEQGVLKLRTAAKNELIALAKKYL